MTTALPAGTRIDGIQIEGVLGSSPASLTYRARDAGSGATVGLEEFLPLQLTERAEGGVAVVLRAGAAAHQLEQGMRRFCADLEVIAGLAHPCIVKVLRVFETNGTAYAVTALDRGNTLERLVRKVPGMRESWVRAILVPLLRALSLTHRAGVLHLGIRAENILLRQAGMPLILGFGVGASAAGWEAQSARMAGYAALEQHTRGRMGPWTDLHAVGALALRCIGHQPPPVLERRNTHGVSDSGALRSLFQDNWRTFSVDFLDATLWMLQLEPADRPEDAQAVLDVLDPSSPATVPAPFGFMAPRPVPAAGGDGLPASDLDALRSALMPLLGPLTDAIVQRAQTRAEDPDQLAEFILDFAPESARDDVIDTLEDVLGLPAYHEPGPAPDDLRGDEPTFHPAPDGPRSGPDSNPDSNRDPSPRLAALEAALARHVGPIAKHLVRRAAGARSGDDLVEHLAGEITDPDARAAFLRQTRST